MPARCARAEAFARDRGLRVLAGRLEIGGALPQARLLEDRAVFGRTRNASASRAPDRTFRARDMPAIAAEGHRRIGQAEGGEADFGIVLPSASAAMASAFMFDVLP